MWLTVVMGNECEHICHSNFIGSYCQRFCWLKWPQIQKCIKASLKKKKKGNESISGAAYFKQNGSTSQKLIYKLPNWSWHLVFVINL